MPYLVFLARNSMVTRVVEKQAKTTKVKNNFVNGKKKFKRILSCLFSGRRKVQFRRKKLGDKAQAKSSNLPCRFCCELSLHTAKLRSGFDAKYSRASAFRFFLSTNMFFAAVRTHFARKNTSIFMLIGNLSRSWPSELIASLRRRRAQFGSRREHEFFSFFFLFFLI